MDEAPSSPDSAAVDADNDVMDADSDVADLLRGLVGSCEETEGAGAAQSVVLLVAMYVLRIPCSLSIRLPLELSVEASLFKLARDEGWSGMAMAPELDNDEPIPPCRFAATLARFLCTCSCGTPGSNTHIQLVRRLVTLTQDVM